MELSTAVRLIKSGVNQTRLSQTWADLGAGSGLFTKALTSLIPSGIIYAIDRDLAAMRDIGSTDSIEVQKINKNFTDKELGIPSCDGILMANSLHYVKDQASFITQIKQKVKPEGVMLILEYDSNSANPWVPYPIPCSALKSIMLNAGFASVENIGEEPSVFNKSVIYSALIKPFE